MFKKFALALLTASLVACSNPPQETSKTTQSTPPASAQSSTEPSTQKFEQTFIVGIDANYQPYTFKDEKGLGQGFDVDIIRAIGEKQNFGVDVVPQSWDDLLKNFSQSKHDIVLAGFSRTPEREKEYLVSNTYSYGEDAILVKQDNTSIKDFKSLAGHKVSTQSDSPYIPELEEIMGKNSPNIIGKPSSFLAFKELTMGNVDAVYADAGILRYYSQEFKDIPMKVVDNGKEGYELVIMTPKNKPELMEKINTGLKEIIADGTYVQIYKKWFGAEPEKIPAIN